MSRNPGTFFIMDDFVGKDKVLSWGEKHILGLIMSLNTNGSCYANNHWFSAKTSASSQACGKIINNLKTKGYIKIEYEDDDKKIDKNRILIPIKGIVKSDRVDKTDTIAKSDRVVDPDSILKSDRVEETDHRKDNIYNKYIRKDTPYLPLLASPFHDDDTDKVKGKINQGGKAVKKMIRRTLAQDKTLTEKPIRRKMVKRTLAPEKNIIPKKSKREQLKSLRPITQSTPQKELSTPSAVKRLITFWNNQALANPGTIKTLLAYKTRNNTQVQTKNYVETVRALKKFLDGTLYEGFQFCVPDFYTHTDFCRKYDQTDFERFVLTLIQVIKDPTIYPKNKDFVKSKATLSTFLIGDSRNAKSLLLNHCWSGVKTIEELKYPQFHENVERNFLKIKPELTGKITGKDLANFDACLEWFVPWCNSNRLKSNMDITRSIANILIPAIDMYWTSPVKPNTAYLKTENCKDLVEKFVRKLNVFIS